MKIIEYACFENVPELLCNQIYTFNTSNGHIVLWEILGKSAINPINAIIKSGDMLKEIPSRYLEQKISTASFTYYITDYEVLKAEYNKFIKKKEEKKIKRSIRNKKVTYLVNKTTGFCQKTSSILPVNKSTHVTFDTKKEAVEYSEKVIDKNLKIVNKQLGKIKEIKKETKDLIEWLFFKKLNSIRCPDGVDTALACFKISPQLIKEADSLIKIERDRTYDKVITLLKINPIELIVKEIIIPNKMVKLSDGTVLTDYECNAYTPSFYKAKRLEDVKVLVEYANLKIITNKIKTIEEQLEQIEGFLENYKPFSSKCFEKYYSPNRINEITKVLNQLLINHQTQWHIQA